jgi:hypothetical protein
MVREAHEDVGRAVPGGELRRCEVLAVGDGVGQPQLGRQVEDGVGIGTGDGRADQQQASPRVVPATVEPERLDQLVLCLVG